MIKNRTAQLIFQTVYCTLGLVGWVACLGIFDNINLIRWDFYVHFTNISNFLCLGVMVGSAVLVALTMYLVDVTRDDAKDLNLTNLQLSLTSIIYYQDPETGEYEDFGIPVPNYTDENVSTKVVKLIQSYTGVVNKMVWRK